MNIRLLQFLDKYAGLPLCAVLSVIKKLLPRRHAGIDRDSVKNILFMKFWGMGSILLLSPAVRGCRDAFPEARLVFLTLSKNAEIAQSLRLFDEVVTIDVNRGWVNFFRTCARCARYFRRQRFDLVVDFEFFTRFSALVTFFTFARVTVGYHSWETWRGDIHTIKVPFNRYWHIMDNFYNLSARLGADKTAHLEIVKPAVSREDKEAVAALMKEHGLEHGFIAVHANVSDLSVERRWPYGNFARLTELVLRQFPVRAVFIGASSERASVRSIIDAIPGPGVVDLVGALTISQLAHLLERARLVIANDSGPLHLAVAMGAPTVSFFGPETPVLYGPRGPRHTVFFNNSDCSPCMNVHNRKSVQCYWRTPTCMEAIRVEDVFNAVRGRLS